MLNRREAIVAAAAGLITPCLPLPLPPGQVNLGPGRIYSFESVIGTKPGCPIMLIDFYSDEQLGFAYGDCSGLARADFR